MSDSPIRNLRDLPPYLKVEEVAQLLRKSPAAIYAMIGCGQLPGVRRIRRSRLVSRDDLLEFIDGSYTPSLKKEGRKQR